MLTNKNQILLPFPVNCKNYIQENAKNLLELYKMYLKNRKMSLVKIINSSNQKSKLTKKKTLMFLNSVKSKLKFKKWTTQKKLKVISETFLEKNNLGKKPRNNWDLSEKEPKTISEKKLKNIIPTNQLSSPLNLSLHNGRKDLMI